MASVHITTEGPRSRHRHQRGQMILKSGQWYVRVYEDRVTDSGVARKRVQLHVCEQSSKTERATAKRVRDETAKVLSRVNGQAGARHKNPRNRWY